MANYTTLRQHYGDKLYMPGDPREAAERDVAHLVEAGVLEPKAEAKAEPATANKAEPAVQNKARK